MKVFQIVVHGIYKNFENKGKFHSKEVYVNEPTQDDIDAFVDKCCNSKHPSNFYDLKRDTVEVIVVELNVNE